MKLRSTASLSRATLRAPFSTTTLRYGRPKKRSTEQDAAPTEPAERIDLPDKSLWRNSFPPLHAKDRISISNLKTAAELAKAFVPMGSKDKVVIEAFPGE
jgi:hypothetical protein